jgi:hypothetical protein
MVRLNTMYQLLQSKYAAICSERCDAASGGSNSGMLLMAVCAKKQQASPGTVVAILCTAALLCML